MIYGRLSRCCSPRIRPLKHENRFGDLVVESRAKHIALQHKHTPRRPKVSFVLVFVLSPPLESNTPNALAMTNSWHILNSIPSSGSAAAQLGRATFTSPVANATRRIGSRLLVRRPRIISTTSSPAAARMEARWPIKTLPCSGCKCPMARNHSGLGVPLSLAPLPQASLPLTTKKNKP